MSGSLNSAAGFVTISICVNESIKRSLFFCSNFEVAKQKTEARINMCAEAAKNVFYLCTRTVD